MNNPSGRDTRRSARAGNAAVVSQHGGSRTVLPTTDAKVLLGRSAEDDRRVVYHEIHHVLAGRLCSAAPIGGVTAEPGLDYSGLTWGPAYVHRAKFAEPDDALSLCEKIGPLMPSMGESRADVADIFLHVQNRCVELVAGTVGEELFLDGPAWIAHDDLRQAHAYAGMICTSPASVEAFLDFCRVEAAALLTALAHIVHALAAELMTRRTMNGLQVDLCIERAVAHETQRVEIERRANWRSIEQSAVDFAAQ
jgi:hypothetical protein